MFVPASQVITTHRAADILRMSLSSFIKRQLEDGLMADHRVGNQRSIHFCDVRSVSGCFSGK
jgi:hypothetical protein